MCYMNLKPLLKIIYRQSPAVECTDTLEHLVITRDSWSFCLFYQTQFVSVTNKCAQVLSILVQNWGLEVIVNVSFPGCSVRYTMTTWMHSDHVSLFRMNHGAGFIPNLHGIYFLPVLKSQYQTWWFTLMFKWCFRKSIDWTRMHPSRMRTVRCNGCHGGWCLPGGGEWRWCLPGWWGVEVVSAWECLPGGGGVCLEVSAQGDVCPGGCMYPSMHWARGVSVPVHAEIHIPLWTDFLTYACENITFPQLRCGR